MNKQNASIAIVGAGSGGLPRFALHEAAARLAVQVLVPPITLDN